MKFSHACIESLAVALPDEAWTSAAIEERLKPLYDRLKLPAGRLELMTGIKERRMWPAGTRPSDASAAAGKNVLKQSRFQPEQMEVLIHSAVCRDMLEPATASFAHHKIGLGDRCQVFDLSNACLGFLNGLVTLAAMVDSGQIKCGMVVSGENGRPLVDRTIKHLLETPMDRNAIKPFFANLTIGSAAVAAIVCHEDLLPAGAPKHRLLAGSVIAATKHSELCQGDSEGDTLVMETDSEQLLLAGVEVAQRTWQAFAQETGWNPSTPDRIITHQVGTMHRRKLYETVGLDLVKDFSSFETLGNTGSAALPSTLALAVEQGALRSGQKAALLGIGSGLNSLMLAVEW
ncbi:3-oxoacyl-[acyl-carrier-protein] synthase 3 [Lacunisphaera limnophila]|uniref:3-oxoacyl-[acyl-carrier-protein] synthase 3 n=1 Tax=Lacunisphaera limnophila TaxID=1838286 RepID=A0A1D8AY77_9BACT|nr:3-oxoacyl-ACP synthase III [Lacunisphaera limnophila]AOS45837.1 3-oxoacyl-[acyl-carrier-protein] synthase 3 [Lacunisphaera limnophila]